jgi:hypothetical protein
MALLYCRDENGVFKEVPCIVGRSAYQTAVKNGFMGTESEWLATLKGDPGYSPQKGKDYFDGASPVKGVDYWTPEDKKEMGDYVNACGATIESVLIDKTLTEADVGKFLRVDAACIITVPNLTVGVELEIFRNTSGNVTIQGDGVSFAIPGNSSLVTTPQTISNQYASICLKQIDDSVWSIQGAV